MGGSVEHRFAEVRDRIARACDRAGRDPDSVNLVAVGKRQPLEKIRAAFDAGHRIFGENHVQEAEGKAAELPPEIRWHLIGPLQSNKSKRAADLFSVVHSVDRPKIARCLERDLAALGRAIPAFVQVRLGGEETKSGYPVEGLAEAIRPLADLEHLRVEGLMAIPPFEEDLDRARDWFRRLRELRDALGERPEWMGWKGDLSMGMSHDFEIAIEEGATHVRVGTALFGERPD